MEVTDRQLLERFLIEKDQSAFQEILNRHGSMVMGVCQRILGNVHDAEDAFQATFLILYQKASSIRNLETLAGWLYRVSSHNAFKLKNKKAIRSEILMEENTLSDETNLDQARVWEEIRAILDEELNRLSERYRLPMILCYLEGASYEEVAQHLGLTHAATKTRLERARGFLKDRLARRGVALPMAALTIALSKNASAVVSPALLHSTVTAATQLAGGATISSQAASPQVLELLKDTGTGIKSLLSRGVQITTEAVLALTRSALATSITVGVIGSALIAGAIVYSTQLSAKSTGGALPDLVVSNIRWFPKNPVPGDPVLFNALIQNQGTAPTPSGTLIGVGFLVDGQLVAWSGNDRTSLKPKASHLELVTGGPNETGRWEASVGTHTITAWVDDMNRITESNESNNQLEATLVVSPK